MAKFLAMITVGLIALCAFAQTGGNATMPAGTQASPASASTDANSNGAGASASLGSGTIIPATLSKSIDAKKAKTGDEVTAKTIQEVRASSGVTIPKGSKLIGHVTDAKARSKGDSESSLSIAFDNVMLKNGQEIPLHANIQALAAPPRNSPTQLGDDNMAGAGAPGASPAPMAGRSNGAMAGTMGNPAGGVAGNPGGINPAAGPVNSTSGTTGNENGELSSSSTGVIGLNGIELSSVGSNSGQASVIVSSGKDLKLDSGTRMVLRVAQ